MHICLCHAYAAAAPASPSPLPAPPLPRRARERRQKQEELDRMRKLGDAGEDVDDVMTWVSRSRQSQQKKAAEAEAAKRRAAEAAARRRDSDQEDDDEDEVRDPGCGGTGYGRLACMAHVGGHPAQCLGDPRRVRFSTAKWTVLQTAECLSATVEACWCRASLGAMQRPSTGHRWAPGLVARLPGRLCRAVLDLSWRPARPHAAGPRHAQRG